MVERIIFFVCCFMCSIPFLIMFGNKDSSFSLLGTCREQKTVFTERIKIFGRKYEAD